jgi:hypothetical protein
MCHPSECSSHHARTNQAQKTQNRFGSDEAKGPRGEGGLRKDDNLRHANLSETPTSPSYIEMQAIREHVVRAHQSVQRHAKPISLALNSYNQFRSCVEGYRRSRMQSPIAELNDFLKSNQEVMGLRSQARAELQNIYDAVADTLDMPKAQVYVPTRKKISVHGLAVAESIEIRIYPIHGPADKEYKQWRVRDVSLDPIEEVCETLLHEAAHIHQWHFARVMDHDETFIKGYEACEQVFLQLGFEPLLPIAKRFTGVPRSSKAAKLTGAARRYADKKDADASETRYPSQ